MLARLQTGDRIADATIEQALGEGGFACVYRAVTDDGKTCAIKVAHEATEVMKTSELGLLHNEIEAVLRLRHPSLVRTHGFGYLPDGRLYIVMDLVSGTTLIDYIEQHGRLDPTEALAILEQVAEVMAHCHEQGVVHLDLKPDNIVITDRHGPTIKVLDFGVARLARSGRGEQLVIAGTPAYMAPECFGHAERGPSMDVYALGVTLHVMLTGELAFRESGGVTAQVGDKYQGPPALDGRGWADVPEGVRDLLRAMLAVAPQERPSMALLGSETRRLYYTALSGEPSGTLANEYTFPPSRPVQSTSLLGRDDDLAALRQHWSRACEQPSPAAMVMGAQGTGKSAVIDRFLEHVQQRTYPRDPDTEPLVAYGRCRESGELVPFGVIREAAGQLGEQLRALPRWRPLARALREALGPLEGVLIGLVPEAQPPGTSPAVVPSPRPAVEAVAKATHVLLQVVTKEQPVLLVIEDVQWAGEGVLDVLEHIHRDPPPGLMLLLSGRGPVPWVHADDVIELQNLAPADNDALLRSLLDTDDTAALQRLCQHVPVLAAGIPMATTSVCADLQLRRCVRRGPSKTLVLNEDRLRAYVPPASVVELLEHRLERLTPSARRVLAAGALYGRGFSIDDLLDMESLLERSAVQRAVLEAHQLGLLHVDGRRCWLAHDALVERLASTWSEEEARQIHGQIADRLAATAGEPGQRADHLERAGHLSRAVRAHLWAARHADVLQEQGDAARHFRRVIELADELPEGARRVAILEEAIFEYARLAGVLGVADEAFAVVERGAAALAEQGATEDSTVDSALARLHYLRGEMGPAVELSRRCLERTGDDPETARIRVLPINLVGRAMYVDGRFGEAAVSLAQGCQLAASQAEQVELCHSLGMLGLSLGYTGDHSEARTYLAQAERIAGELADPVRHLASVCYEAIGAEYEYDWRKGLIRSADALAFAQQNNIGGLYPAVALIYAGRHQFHTGRLQRARLLLDHAVERSRRNGLRTGQGWAQAFLGDVAFVDGELEEAARCYDRGLQVAPDDQLTRAMCLMGRAHVRGEREADPFLMHADAEEALSCLSKVENVATSAHALLRYADATEQIEGIAAAQPLRERARAVFERLGVEPVSWWPTPPASAGSTLGDPREYWRSGADGHAPPVVELVPLPSRLTDAVLHRVTQRLTEEAFTLRRLSPPRLVPRRPGE